MTLWITDPKTKEPSVSLTLLLVSFAGVLIVGALKAAGAITEISLFPEIFYSSTALYFGRRLSIGGRDFTSAQAENIAEKIE